MVARSQILGIPEAQIQIKVYCVMPKTSLETPCFGIVNTSVIYFGVCVCVCVCGGGGGGGGGGGSHYFLKVQTWSAICTYNITLTVNLSRTSNPAFSVLRGFSDQLKCLSSLVCRLWHSIGKLEAISTKLTSSSAEIGAFWRKKFIRELPMSSI